MHALLLVVTLAVSQIDMMGDNTPSVDFSGLGATTVSPDSIIFDCYSPSWCAGCRLTEKEIQELTSQGLAQVNFHRSSKEYPVKVLNLIAAGGVYPVILWRTNTGKEYSLSDGWKGNYNLLTRYNRSCQIKEPPKTQPPKPVQQLVIPARSGAHWTHPDTIYRHLIQEHGYSPAQLRGLSEEQMLSLHDAAHEGRTAPARRPGRIARFFGAG
jgi:hypothetical protein